MWYWLLNIAVAFWVFKDAQSRRMDNPIAWAVGTFFIMIAALPFYYAKRNLKSGEVREGGTAWNVIKVFSLAWTAMMFIASIAGLFAATSSVSPYASSAHQAGAAIGTAMGMGMMLMIWIVVLVGALVIGLFLKKSSIVETGPTGNLLK